MGRMHGIPRVSFEHILVLATSVAYEHCKNTAGQELCRVQYSAVIHIFKDKF